MDAADRGKVLIEQVFPEKLKRSRLAVEVENAGT
jgi:hypothetical protein